MRIALVDPSAFTPPYDHALAAALAAEGEDVELFTSRFAYGAVTPGPGAAASYAAHEHFYRHAAGRPGSRARRASKLLEHIPDMLRLRRATAAADVVHFQWFGVPMLDRALLPRNPLVITAHDLLPREPRPGQLAAQRALLARADAVIVHSEHGRRALLDGLGLDPSKLHVVRHGAFAHLAALPPAPLPPELHDDGRPVVLCFGLIRPYKGVDVLLDAWPADAEAQLWIVGRPMLELAPLQAKAPQNAHFLPRFVSDQELAAIFRRADLAVLPYTRTDRFDASGVLATALAFGVPVLASEIGGFSEIAATGAARLVPPGDASALRAAIEQLLSPEERATVAAATRAAATGSYAWATSARDTLAVYRQISGA